MNRISHRGKALALLVRELRDSGALRAASA
jgi:inosine/xanthosine triphosphate pyrophosphatase family protein